jgi:hypothetical protein
MPRGKSSEDLHTLQMALVGYQMERQKIDEKIREIQSRLGGRRAAAPAGGGAAKKIVKRVLSPEARKRIAAAQKKRWAEHRRKLAATE